MDASDLGLRAASLPLKPEERSEREVTQLFQSYSAMIFQFRCRPSTSALQQRHGSYHQTHVHHVDLLESPSFVLLAYRVCVLLKEAE